MPTRVRVSLSDPDPVDVEARGTEPLVEHTSASRGQSRARHLLVSHLHYICQILARLATNTPFPVQTAAKHTKATHCARGGGGRTCARATRPGPRPPARPHIAPGAPRLDTHVCAVRHGQRAPTLDRRALSSVAVHGPHRSPLPYLVPAPSEAHAAATVHSISLSVCDLTASHVRRRRAGLGSAQGRPRRARAARMSVLLRRASAHESLWTHSYMSMTALALRTSASSTRVTSACGRHHGAHGVADLGT